MADDALAATADPGTDDTIARRNALILALAQGCTGFCATTVVIFGGYVGLTYAPDKTLATLPITTMMIGVLFGTLPMAAIMQRFGRRTGFQLGAVFGILAALTCVRAIEVGNFWLFCLGTHLFGYYQSSASYYRFAAADMASPKFRPTAISWALAGGLLSALITPEVLTRTRELWVPFAASYMACGVAAVLGLALVSQVRIPTPKALAKDAPSGRPLREIISQPRFIAALAAGIVSYGMMNLVMTATPLAMAACSFTPDDASHSIRWHILAMFAPSFFTGNLIARFGRVPMALIGLVLLAGCAAAALSGITLTNFTVAMVALGLGWNFSYISATTMVTDCHTAEERTKTQAFNDLCIFGFVAFTSYLAGRLLNTTGWTGVNLTLIPFVILAAALIILAPRFGKRVAS